jgi:hypothetical protein
MVVKMIENTNNSGLPNPEGLVANAAQTISQVEGHVALHQPGVGQQLLLRAMADTYMQSDFRAGAKQQLCSQCPLQASSFYW